MKEEASVLGIVAEKNQHEIELKPLVKKAFRPDDEHFDTSLNPAVQVAENAKYEMWDYHPDRTRAEEIKYAKIQVSRVEPLPDEYIPPLARQNIAEAKRAMRSYPEAGIEFSSWEKTYLREKYDLYQIRLNDTHVMLNSFQHLFFYRSRNEFGMTKGNSNQTDLILDPPEWYE